MNIDETGNQNIIGTQELNAFTQNRLY